MFCNKCGAQINEESQFCYKCGAPIDVNKKTNPSQRIMKVSSFNTKTGMNNNLIIAFFVVLVIVVGFFVFGKNESINITETIKSKQIVAKEIYDFKDLQWGESIENFKKKFPGAEEQSDNKYFPLKPKGIVEYKLYAKSFAGEELGKYNYMRYSFWNGKLYHITLWPYEYANHYWDNKSLVPIVMSRDVNYLRNMGQKCKNVYDSISNIMTNTYGKPIIDIKNKIDVHDRESKVWSDNKGTSIRMSVFIPNTYDDESIEFWAANIITVLQNDKLQDEINEYNKKNNTQQGLKDIRRTDYYKK